MALIKCTECGHEVSDKASECPNCGCPINNVDAVQEKPIEEELYVKEPQKKKWWIWALAALLCLIGGSVYFFVSTRGNTDKEAPVAEKTDSTDKKENFYYDKDAIVIITPEFTKAIEQYDKLGIFSEGLAAVCKDDKWGYINTKGEEVIPCKYRSAEAFSDGLAAVKKSGKWGYIDVRGQKTIPIDITAEMAGQFSEGLAFVYREDRDGNASFSVINKQGNVVFDGKCDFSGIYGSELEAKLLPKYNQGELYVPVDLSTSAVYDSNGMKRRTADYYDKMVTAGKYIVATEDGEGEFFKVGLRNANGKMVIPAIYDGVNDTGFGENTEVSNGVVLVMLQELGDDVYEGPGDALESSDTKYYYGYADLKGNDTFSERIKSRCRKANDRAVNKILSQRADEAEAAIDAAVSYDYDGGSAYSANEDLSWLEGNWRYQMRAYGEVLEMRVGISGETIAVFMNGEHYYTGSYSIEGNHLVYNRRNGMSDYLVIDRNNQCLKADENNNMQRF